MDNKAANELKQAIRKYTVSYQLTPPHIHRINAAEHAICTFKNHFISCLASVDPNYPINECDRLLPQSTNNTKLTPYIAFTQTSICLCCLE